MINYAAFWFNEFDGYTKAFRAEAIAPILNKVGIFSTSSVLKNIFGQDEKGLDFKEIMDDGKILLVNLAKGKLGEDVCALLGSMIVDIYTALCDCTEHGNRNILAEILSVRG
jgi:hypothetical protein